MDINPRSVYRAEGLKVPMRNVFQYTWLVNKVKYLDNTKFVEYQTMQCILRRKVEQT